MFQLALGYEISRPQNVVLTVFLSKQARESLQSLSEEESESEWRLDVELLE